MKITRRNGIVLLATGGLVLPGLPSLAQDVEAQQDDIGIRIRGGGLHQFETDIDDGGDFDVSRFDGSIDLTLELGDDLDMALNLGFERSMYDFSGGPGSFGMGNPWDDINTGSAGARFTLQTSNQW
jgi:hypothetical protein